GNVWNNKQRFYTTNKLLLELNYATVDIKLLIVLNYTTFNVNERMEFRMEHLFNFNKMIKTQRKKKLKLSKLVLNSKQVLKEQFKIEASSPKPKDVTKCSPT
ncbi:hypothetical protein DOY81_004197, partial [Sarcophaga bullata]